MMSMIIPTIILHWPALVTCKHHGQLSNAFIWKYEANASENVKRYYYLIRVLVIACITVTKDIHKRTVFKTHI